ncbi:ABC-type transporter Mla subunit MlaD [Salibacterium salarium]|nr:ABC-type transporter Mla subunit MlaD [Salibacterium salarium]
MEKKDIKWYKRWKLGIIVSGISAILVMFANRKTREKIVDGTKQTASTVNEASSFLSNNREEIIAKVKTTSNDLSELLKSATHDIQFITDKANHLKETSVNMKDRTLQAADEIKDLKDVDDDESISLNRTDNVKQLPTNNNS